MIICCYVSGCLFTWQLFNGFPFGFYYLIQLFVINRREFSFYVWNTIQMYSFFFLLGLFTASTVKSQPYYIIIDSVNSYTYGVSYSRNNGVIFFAPPGNKIVIVILVCVSVLLSVRTTTVSDNFACFIFDLCERNVFGPTEMLRSESFFDVYGHQFPPYILSNLPPTTVAPIRSAKYVRFFPSFNRTFIKSIKFCACNGSISFFFFLLI